MVDRVQRNLRMLRRLVRVVNPGEALDLPPPCAGVHPLGIPLLADLQRCIHEHLHEMVAAHHVAYLASRSAIGANSRTDHCATVAHDFCSYESNAPDINTAFLLAEP